MLSSFIKAKAIYPKKYKKEMNISLFFVLNIDLEKECKLVLTGNSIYRIFDNGIFSFYGPTRAARNFYRIDQLSLCKGKHFIVIELSGYNCNSYYLMNSLPFIQAEVVDGENALAWTGRDFDCYLNTTRVKRVSRFSYQRNFSESYVFNKNPENIYNGDFSSLTKLETNVYCDKKYLSRIVDSLVLKKEEMTVCETGNFKHSDELKIYEDRYMFLDYLKIFPKETWDDNPNDLISQLVFSQSDKNKNKMVRGEFSTYCLNRSHTGFIDISLDAEEDTELYVIFDEINSSENGDVIDIKFYRNTTNNIVSYKIAKGHFHHISFEPYTIRFLRICVTKGKISNYRVSVIDYENPLPNKIEYNFADSRINSIFQAGIATFAQNSVDILTDCPSRERAGWLCDSYFSGRSELLIEGSNKVEKAFLDNYAMCGQIKELPKGMIPMCYPGDFPDGNFIPNWSLFYILELEEYLDRTNDYELINKSKSKIVGLLNYFKKLENSYSLLENLQGWIFVEWSKANDDEFIKGVNFPSNMLYAAALESASRLLGDQSLFEKGQTIKANIKKMSFNGEFFVDNMIRNSNGDLVLTNNITETCQYYAFYFGIADKKQYPDLYQKVLNDFGPTRDDSKVYPNVYRSNVFIGDYLRLAILLRNGESKKVFGESVDYFYKMAMLTGTLWEHDSTFASLNHCFASYIVNIILNMTFGLSKVSIKDRKIFLDNNFYPIQATVSIHTPYGIIKLSNDGKKVNVLCPKELELVKNEGNI